MSKIDLNCVRNCAKFYPLNALNSLYFPTAFENAVLFHLQRTMDRRVLKEKVSFPKTKKPHLVGRVYREKRKSSSEKRIFDQASRINNVDKLCEERYSRDYSWMARNPIRELLMNKLPVMLKNKPFYHGYLPKLDAEEILKNQENGSFIVRMTNECGDYCAVALSIKHEEKVVHYMIDVNINGRCFINSLMFNSVSEMVNYYVKSGQPIDKTSNVRLKRPARFVEWQLESHHIVNLEKNINIGKDSDVIRGVFLYKGKNADVAIKIPLNSIQTDSTNILFDELRAMRQLKCNYTLKAYGIASFTCRPLLVTEYADRGTLHDYIRTHSVSVHEKLRYSRQIMSALKYLKDKNLIHRNIVAKKCFLFTSPEFELPTVKLGGFRYCISASEKDVKKVPRKLLCCCPPEAIKCNKWFFESDLWMSSMLMWSIFTGYMYPFREFVDEDPMNLYYYLLKGQRLPMSTDLLPDVQLIISQCQATNPSDRGTIEMALQRLTVLLDSHPYSKENSK
ncbi:Fer-related kinase [Trichinella spiralis]|uniref:Tyrosine-protein kinase n=1 Tax=Trichinella spiralis TaxID=6334 RepID=A0ABR3KA93_TRISP